MEEVGDHWNQISNNDLITSLTPQEQTTIAINRFCIGITNHRNLPAFRNLQNLLKVYQGNNNIRDVVKALASGGYNTPSARFLNRLLKPEGIPQTIVSTNGNVTNTVVIVLKLEHRVSKNLKEIHLSSLPDIEINVASLNEILQWANVSRNTINCQLMQV